MPKPIEADARVIFVTGGTGFVGREVVRELSAAGYRPRLLVRNPQHPAAKSLAEKFRAEIRKGDVTEGTSLSEAMAGSQGVIHLVGIISEAREKTFENVHIRGARNIVEATKKAGVKRLVHMSALGTRPNAASRYHQSKWMAEEAVRQSGLDYTIFRPSLIFGPGDQFVNLFAKLARYSPILPMMGPPTTRFQPVAVETVAAAFVRSLGEPKTIGRTYDLCGPDTLTLPEILEEILLATKKRRLKVQIPRFAAQVQANLLEFVCGTVLGKPPPLNRDQLTMLREDNVGDRRQAMTDLNLPELHFREGIQKWLK